MKKLWTKLMTAHIFKVYLIFVVLSLIFLLSSRIVITRCLGIGTSKSIGVLVLVGFFLILGFPGIITIFRREFIRPIGKQKSGNYAILGGIIYLVFTYGALGATLYYLLK